jgi:hypothetical protein
MINDKSFNIDKIDGGVYEAGKKGDEKLGKRILEDLVLRFRYSRNGDIFAAVMHRNDAKVNYNFLKKKIGLNAANLVIEVSDSIAKGNYESDEEFIIRKRERKLEILTTASPKAVMIEGICAIYTLEMMRNKIKKSDLAGDDLLPIKIDDLNYQGRIAEIVYDRLPKYDPVSMFLKEKHSEVFEMAENRCRKIKATFD